MAISLSRRISSKSLIAASTIVLTMLVFFFVSGHWQVLTSNIGCANDTIRLRQPILRALESYREQYGRYPRHVEEFSRELDGRLSIELDASSFPASDWRYLYLSDDDYRIVTTTCHFISSFDAVVYQRSENYPADWQFSNQSYRVRAGYYLIGAQRRMELGEPLF